MTNNMWSIYSLLSDCLLLYIHSSLHPSILPSICPYHASIPSMLYSIICPILQVISLVKRVSSIDYKKEVIMLHWYQLRKILKGKLPHDHISMKHDNNLIMSAVYLLILFVCWEWMYYVMGHLIVLSQTSDRSLNN